MVLLADSPRSRPDGNMGPCFGDRTCCHTADLVYMWAQQTECLCCLEIHNFEVLTLSMMVLGGVVLGMQLGHKGGAPMNGINVLIKGTLSARQRHREKLALYNPEEGPHRSPTLISDVQVPEL